VGGSVGGDGGGVGVVVVVLVVVETATALVAVVHNSDNYVILLDPILSRFMRFTSYTLRLCD